MLIAGQFREDLYYRLSAVALTHNFIVMTTAIVLSGILMVLVGFSGGTEMGLWTIAIYLAVQNFDGYILVPMIAKKTVDLAPALVLGFQLVMGVLFGVLGLTFADPMLAMIKVALERRSHRLDEGEDQSVADGDASAPSTMPA